MIGRAAQRKKDHWRSLVTAKLLHVVSWLSNLALQVPTNGNRA
jgi:hypothetical protein